MNNTQTLMHTIQGFIHQASNKKTIEEGIVGFPYTCMLFPFHPPHKLQETREEIKVGFPYLNLVLQYMFLPQPLLFSLSKP